MRIVSVIVAIVIGLLTLTACGGGGGGGETPGTAISGVASKGIIRNGAIRVYALNADGSKGALLKDTVTDSGGAYRADLGTYHGPVLVEASGSYTDEATGATRTIPADAPLRAAVDNVAGEARIAVTPLTELAVQRGEDPLTHKVSVATIATNNALISTLFKVDIIGTMPVDPLTASATATQSQKEHALVLAAFASLMKSQGKELAAVITELKDAIGADNRIVSTVAVEFQSALADFAGNPANRTGITDVSATPLINIGGSTRALTISVTGTTALIAGLDIVVTLPPGGTVKAASTGLVSSGVLQPPVTLSNALVAGNYTPPTASARARVRLGIISATGFAVGELVTLQCDVAPDAAFTESDFGLSVQDAYDANSVKLSGLSLAAKLGS